MGCALVHKFGQRRRNLVFFWLFLVIVTCSTCAKGRPMPAKLIHDVEDNNVNTETSSSSTQMNKTKDEENVVIISRVMRRRILLLGSSPPRCERRCSSCGGEPCKAVQVPIVPSNKKLRVSRSHHDRHFHHFYPTKPTLVIAYSRGDDISNYKPMCWKCKCGNFIFNP